MLYTVEHEAVLKDEDSDLNERDIIDVVLDVVLMLYKLEYNYYFHYFVIR